MRRLLLTSGYAPNLPCTSTGVSFLLCSSLELYESAVHLVTQDNNFFFWNMNEKYNGRTGLINFKFLFFNIIQVERSSEGTTCNVQEESLRFRIRTRIITYSSEGTTNNFVSFRIMKHLSWQPGSPIKSEIQTVNSDLIG